ncbi:MAG: LytTR family transcriptional regulator [Tissierellia bacterium]|nr:LytTR family transcriptional regulator [Tissierellia bacterium]
MNVNLYKIEEGFERIDIYYNTLNSNLNKIIEIASSVSPQINLQDEKSTFLVYIDDIYYFEFVDRTTFAYLEEKVYSIDKSLK